MATDKQASLPSASVLASYVGKRVVSLKRSRDLCDAELLIISGERGLETRVSYLKKRIQDIDSQLNLLSKY